MPRGFTVQIDARIAAADTRGLMDSDFETYTSISDRCREVLTGNVRDWMANQISRKLFGMDYYQRDPVFTRNAELGQHLHIGDRNSFFTAIYSMLHLTRHVTDFSVIYSLHSRNEDNLTLLADALICRYPGCEYAKRRPTTNRDDIFSKGTVLTRGIQFTSRAGLNALWPTWWMIYFDRALEYLENECGGATLNPENPIEDFFGTIGRNQAGDFSDVVYNSYDTGYFRELWSSNRRHIDVTDWLTTGSGPCAAHSGNAADEYASRRREVRRIFRRNGIRVFRRADDPAVNEDEEFEDAEIL